MLLTHFNTLCNVNFFTYRLLVNQYPHLCLVEDWLDEAMLESKSQNSIMHVPGLYCTTSKLTQGRTII